MPYVKDRFLQPDVEDPVLEERKILELVHPFLPDAKRVTAVDETGGEARMYAIDEDFVLKMQRRNMVRLSCSQEREKFFLDYLADALPQISVPRVLGHFKEGTMLEGTVMTRMPGRAVRYVDQTLTQRTAMLLENGKALALMHSLDQKPFLDRGDFPNDENATGLRERYLNTVVTRISRMRDIDIPDSEKEAAHRLALAVLEDLREVEVMVAIHSNPYMEHVFVNEDKSYSGIIDFGNAYIGHPIGDMRRWNTAERKTLLQGYLGGRPMSSSFAQIWDISYALDALTTMISRQIRVSQLSKKDLLQWEWQ